LGKRCKHINIHQSLKSAQDDLKRGMKWEKTFGWVFFAFLDATLMHHRLILKRSKLPQSTKCVFVSYNLESKRYKLIILKLENLIMSWNVIFNEEP
jgi:hypothetical protein